MPRVFNAAITEVGDRLVMCYRVVLGDGRRRLAICHLDNRCAVLPASIIALSDHLTGAGTWHADGRFLAFGERLFLHFNNGFCQPQGIFIVELDQTAFLPLGPAKPLRLVGPRRRVEKNWMLFTHAGVIYAIYSIVPHVVLSVEETDTAFVCRPLTSHDWDAGVYTRRFGQPRGGTPPVWHDGTYQAFFHSTYPLPRWRRLLNRVCYGRGNRVRQYAAGFYRFSASPPFHVTHFTPIPVLFPETAPRYPRLNGSVERSVYPCGAILCDDHWLVSYGLNDEQVCIRALSDAELKTLTLPMDWH